MTNFDTDLSDLFSPAPGIPVPINGRAAEGPSAVSATPVARKPKRSASDQMTISEAIIPGTMSEAEFAAFLGIARGQVRTKTRDGVFVKDGRGRWNVRESLHNYLSQLRDGANTGAKSQPVRKRKSKGKMTSSQPQKVRPKKEKLHPGMSFAHYLANAEHWESEFQSFIDQAFGRPKFPADHEIIRIDALCEKHSCHGRTSQRTTPQHHGEHATYLGLLQVCA